MKDPTAARQAAYPSIFIDHFQLSLNVPDELTDAASLRIIHLE